MEQQFRKEMSAKEALLAEQEQAHRAALAQKEEDAEEEKLRKKLKERRDYAYLAYSKLYEERQAQIRAMLGEPSREQFFHMHLKNSFHYHETLLQQLAGHHDAITRFIFGCETDEQKRSREALQQSLEIGENEVGAIALSVCSDNNDTSHSIEMVFRAEQSEESFRQLAAQGHETALYALQELQNGSAKKLEGVLKSGLIRACYAFSHSTDPATAIHWSKQANSILSVICTHPLLFQNGMEGKLLELSTGISAMGRMMENGYEALKELQSTLLAGNQMTYEQEQQLNARILLMQQVDSKRSSEVYKSFFAQEYHPKRGLPGERFEKLLETITRSKTMQKLSRLAQDERVFCLSDHLSRGDLAEQLNSEHLFALPAVEKAPKVPVLNSPILQF